MKISASVAGKIHEIPEPSLADCVAFERHFGISSTVLAPDEADASSFRMEWIAFLVYRGLVRLGAVEKDESFDDVIDKVDDFDIDPETEDEAGEEGKDSEPADS